MNGTNFSESFIFCNRVEMGHESAYFRENREHPKSVLYSETDDTENDIFQRYFDSLENSKGKKIKQLIFHNFI